MSPNGGKSALPSYLHRQQRKINQALQLLLPAPGAPPAVLHEAMHYSVFAGGKRLRPILLIASAECIEGRKRAGRTTQPGVRSPLFAVAAAVELIHTYSLVHDDLPAMDDDDFRRGRPTCHRRYDEATAILVGDALLTLAFESIAAQADRLRPQLAARLAEELAGAAGSRGMIGGQQIDVHAARRNLYVVPAEAEVRSLHLKKTAALIRASVRMGGMIAGAEGSGLKRLSTFGERIGLAFQIVDDLLDIEGDPATMGKPVRRDAAQRRWTYPEAVGVDRAKKEATVLKEEALGSLAPFGPSAETLRAIARYVVERES